MTDTVLFCKGLPKDDIMNLKSIFWRTMRELDKQAHERLTELIEDAGFNDSWLRCEFNNETMEESWYSRDKLIFIVHPLEFFEQDGESFINNTVTARIRITRAH